MKSLWRVVALGMALVWLQGCSGSRVVRDFAGERESQAIASVQVPGPITLEKVDGRDLKDVPSIEQGFYTLELLPGVHTINFKYERYWGGANDGLVVKSDEVVVKADFKPGARYEIRYPEPKNREEAERLASRMEATLVESGGGLSFAALPQGHPGLLTVAPVAAAPVVAAPVVTPAPSLAQQEEAVMQQDPLKRLKFWWLMAEEKDQKAFMEWMKSARP